MVMVPAATLPTASNMEDRLLFCPCTCPANMGPPDTKIVGIFTLAAAINRPGTFLSQLGIHTRPSKPCAIAIHSVLSAIRSLVTREYFIPTCPMAIPSHTAMAGNTTGIPPAMATPIFTASVILSRFMCPGTISLKELTIPIIGRLLSSSVNPRALNRLLWGAWAVPVFTESLLIMISLFLLLIFSSLFSLYRINVLPGQMASDSLCQKVAHLGTAYLRAALRHDIAGAEAVLQYFLHRCLDGICFFIQVKAVTKHHSRA